MTLMLRRTSVHLYMAAAAFGVLLFAMPAAPASPDPDPDIPSVQSTRPPQSIDEQLRVAGDYLSGRGVPQDLSLAAYWYEKAAGAGDPQAQLQTGYLYESGIGVPRDPARAFHWYQLAAAAGLVRAKANLGVAYLWGTGVAKNEQMAYRLFIEAAASGSGLAAGYLGDMYRVGVGVGRDQAAAERWYMKGVKLHDPKSEFSMGSILYEAKDHAPDLRTAAKLLRESASSGYVPAMHLLGFLLARNPGMAKSPEEAVSWLNESANAGLWRSSLVLGILARDGNGVPADTRAAYYHFRVALLQGGEVARKYVEHDLQSLAGDLGPSQTSAIDAQAQQWFQLHHAVLEFKFKEGENETRFPAYALAAPATGVHAVQLMPTPVE
jgi:uncharacterized protein